MGFFGRLFGGDEEKNTGEEARRKTVSGFQALELQSATGRSLASIDPYGRAGVRRDLSSAEGLKRPDRDDPHDAHAQ